MSIQIATTLYILYTGTHIFVHNFRTVLNVNDKLFEPGGEWRRAGSPARRAWPPRDYPPGRGPHPQSIAVAIQTVAIQKKKLTLYVKHLVHRNTDGDTKKGVTEIYLVGHL